MGHDFLRFGWLSVEPSFDFIEGFGRMDEAVVQSIGQLP
ncbi:hypothetical protein NRB20_50980 [Nocardia sp. RB20]|uniref:Uncharacterized protein n=1 Tax=Nocardia macrotermitis TaxID=2585198 RepID=A0A7K0D873_9NOCA|nr:hypothetical protein [Nocardia macrotermitis]